MIKEAIGILYHVELMGAAMIVGHQSVLPVRGCALDFLGPLSVAYVDRIRNVGFPSETGWASTIPGSLA